MQNKFESIQNGSEPWEIELEKERQEREAAKEAYHKDRPKKKKEGREKTVSSEYKKEKIEKAQFRKLKNLSKTGNNDHS